jgi:hypothetical protein
MSASSIGRAANDPQLQDRVRALTQKEVIYNAALGDTVFGKQVQAGLAPMSALYWAIAVDAETPYETALLNGRGAPGFDTDIITDAQITSAINAHWPYTDAEQPPARG